MSTFDKAEANMMLAILEAEDRHPDRSDGPPARFPVFRRPRVHVGHVIGHAVAYTPHYGLVVWVDGKKNQHIDWFPAADITRVDPKPEG